MPGLEDYLIGVEEIHIIPEMKETIVGAGNTREDEHIKSFIRDIIEKSSNKFVTVYGRSGAGKTTLYSLTLKSLIENKKTVYKIVDPDSFDAPKFKNQNQAYILMDVENTDFLKELYTKFFLLNTDTLSRIILFISELDLPEELYILNNDRRFYNINISLEPYNEEILKEIINRNMKYFKINNLNVREYGEINELLIQKSREMTGTLIGKPLFCNLTVKLLAQEIENIGKYRHNILNEMPTEANKIISMLLNNEFAPGHGNNRAMIIIYYIISHYPKIPDIYEANIRKIWTIEKKPGLIENYDHQLYLPSLYRNVIDNFINHYNHLNNNDKNIYKNIYESIRYVMFEQNSTMDLFKRYFNKIFKAFNRFEDKTFKKLEKDLENFDNYINFSNNIDFGDISDFTLLISMSKIIEQKIFKINSDSEFNLFTGNAEYNKLNGWNMELYDPAITFLTDNYLKKIPSDSKLGRPFYYIIILYFTQIFNDEFTERVFKQFSGKNHQERLTLKDFFKKSIEGPLFVQKYISYLSYILNKFKYFELQDDYDRFMLYYCEQEYSKSLKFIDIAIKKDPDNPVYHDGRGEVLERLGRDEEALKEYEIANNENPDNPIYHVKIEIILEGLNRHEELLELYENILEKKPNNIYYHYAKGKVLSQLNRNEEALKEYLIVIKLDSSSIFSLTPYIQKIAGMDNEIGGMKRVSDAVDTGLINKKNTL